MLQKIILVGTGGFIGCVLRYLISIYTPKIYGNFLIGTLLANILGCLIIGFVTGLSINKIAVSENCKLFFTTGLCGGFTTFSTFSMQTISLFKQSKILAGILNMSFNLFFSFIGVIIGLLLSRLF